jgi:hypothetical protein
MSSMLPQRQAIYWANRTASWMRQSTEQMAVVVKDVRDGPASSLILDKRMHEVLKSTMFVDPMNKFQKNIAQA